MFGSKNKSDSSLSKSEHKGEHILFFGSKYALVGGIIAGSIALAGQWMVGQVYSGWQAHKLLESVISAGLYFGGAIVTGSATILALMLTMLGVTRQTNSEFDAIFFKRIERIGKLSTISFIAGVLLLLFLSVPVQKSDEVPTSWYTAIYYILTSFIAILSGLIVTIVLMLFNAIESVINTLKPDVDEEVEDAKDREEKETEEEKEQIDDSAS